MFRLAADLRYAVRMLLRDRGFAIVTVLVLALGIGTSTAIYTVVDHIVFRPLDLPDSERLVALCEASRTSHGFCSVSPPDATDWAARSRTLHSIGIARSETFAWSRETGARTLTGGIATPSFLQALGVRPVLGRLLQDSDMPPAGNGQVVVLDYGMWQSDLGGDPAAVGREIVLDGKPYRVVGVLPEGTQVPRLEWVRFWTPVPFDPRDEENRTWRGLIAVGRLAPNATVASASAELNRIQRALAREHPVEDAGWTVTAIRMRDQMVGGARRTLLVFLGAVGVVLILVCVNVANLLLARAATRERELAVRSALGARRGVLARQLLTESGVLALLGGIGGLLVALVGTRTFVRLAPTGIPRVNEIAMDGRVFLFVLGVTVACGLLVGLAPAVHTNVGDLMRVLRHARTSASRRAGRLRRGLVVGELALTLMLVAGAALLLRSYSGLLDWNPGFDPDHVLTFQVFPGMGRYPAPEQLLGFYREAEDRLRALPGVVSVGMASSGPLFGGGDGTTPFLIAGRSDWTRANAPGVSWYDVSPDYFATLGVPVIAGRPIAETDRAGSETVALINETMARRYWPNSSPVGARLTLPDMDFTVQVIGVVRDIPSFYPGQSTDPELYWSNRQHPRWATYFVLRTATDPASLAQPAAAALHAVNPNVTPSSVRTVAQLTSAERVRPRFNALLVASFAVVALVLGMVGIYGVISYTVQQRAQEIGIRLALGARRRRVLRDVGMDGARLIVLGVLLGLGGALLLSRTLRGMLYGVAPTDASTLAVTVVVVMLAAVGAVLVPAVRASGTDPMRVLRGE